jgi:DNA-binding transcriptional regulator/RsmH inhibitor MraZ
MPDYLRDFAGISSDCVVAGAFDRIEIWSNDRYQTYTAKLNSRREEIAEKLSETGI